MFDEVALVYRQWFSAAAKPAWHNRSECSALAQTLRVAPSWALLSVSCWPVRGMG